MRLVRHSSRFGEHRSSSGLYPLPRAFKGRGRFRQRNLRHSKRKNTQFSIPRKSREPGMKQLRNYGIYRISGLQRSLYLVPNGVDTYFLYDCEFGSRIPPRFQIAACGRITNWFEDFPVWTVNDLIDTGETYGKQRFSAAETERRGCL